MAKQAPVVRMTTAGRSHGQDIALRQKRYLVSMSIRTVSFVLAILSIGHWWLWVFVAASFFLPTIAVVVANSNTPPDVGGPGYFQPDLSTRALGGSTSGDQSHG